MSTVIVGVCCVFFGVFFERWYQQWRSSRPHKRTPEEVRADIVRFKRDITGSVEVAEPLPPLPMPPKPPTHAQVATDDAELAKAVATSVSLGWSASAKWNGERCAVSPPPDGRTSVTIPDQPIRYSPSGFGRRRAVGVLPLEAPDSLASGDDTPMPPRRIARTGHDTPTGGLESV